MSSLVSIFVIISLLASDLAQADWRTGVEILPGKIAHLSEYEQKLLLEYPPHAKALREFYNNLTIDGVLVREVPRETGGWIIEGKATGTFKTRGFDHFKVDFLAGEGRTLGMMNPREWYLFQGVTAKDQLFINSHGKSYAEEVDNLLGTYLYNQRPFWLGTLYGALTNPEKSSKVYRVTEATSLDGERIVRITVHSVYVEPHVVHCTVDLLKDRSWATSEIVYASPYSREKYYNVDRISCRYGDTISGIPGLTETFDSQSFRVPFGDGPEDPMLVYQPKLPEEPPKRDRVTISKLIPGPPPVEEFDPAPILAQIGGIGRTQTNSFRGFLLWINAIFLLFLGAYLLKKKKKKPEPTPPEQGSPSAVGL